MPDSWAPFEETLYRAAAEQLNLFSKLTQRPFYGFAFDCNADYGDVLCVPTPRRTCGRRFKAILALQRRRSFRLRWNADWGIRVSKAIVGHQQGVESAVAGVQESCGRFVRQRLYGMMVDEDDNSRALRAAVCGR
jgi:hypothetical protein